MTTSTVREECPHCHGRGITPIRATPATEAVVCPLCEGKGWRLHHYKPFIGRPPRIASVQLIRRSMGKFPNLDAMRTGATMSYTEFDVLFPAEVND